MPKSKSHPFNLNKAEVIDGEDTCEIYCTLCKIYIEVDSNNLEQIMESWIEHTVKVSGNTNV